MEHTERNLLKQMTSFGCTPSKTITLYCRTAKNYLAIAIDWMEACSGQSYKKIHQEMEVLKSYLANIQQKIQEASQKESLTTNHEQLDYKIAEVKRRMEESKKQIMESEGDKIKKYYEQKQLERLTNRNQKAIKPKHPVSSFFVYYKDKGQILAQEKGLTVGSKVAKFVAQLWKNMSNQEKEPYEAKARVSRSQYESEMTQFKNRYPGEFAQLKKDKKHAKNKRKEEQQKLGLEQFNKTIDPQQRKIDEMKDEGKEHQELESASSEGSLMEDELSNSLESVDQTNPKNAQSLNEPTSQTNQISQPASEEADKQLDGMDIEAMINYLDSENKVSPSSSESYKPQDNSGKSKPSDKVKVEEKKSSPQNFVRPKAPISSFFLFYGDKSKQLSQKLGISLGPKLIKLASEVWNKLANEQKKPYMQEAKISREEYHKEMNRLRAIYGNEALMRKKGPRAKTHKK